MARVVFTPAAREHLAAIRSFIARDSPSAAGQMVRRNRAEVGRPASFPQSGRVVPEYGDPRIREVIVAPYRVVYHVQTEAAIVRIVGIVHGSRILPSDLSD